MPKKRISAEQIVVRKIDVSGDVGKSVGRFVRSLNWSIRRLCFCRELRQEVLEAIHRHIYLTLRPSQLLAASRYHYLRICIGHCLQHVAKTE
jgi:hypothetical protein